MNTPPSMSVRIRTSTMSAASTALSKLQELGSLAAEKTRKRVSDACEAYHAKIEQDRALALASKTLGAEEAPTLQQARIGAVLVCPVSRQVVPLFAGTNHLRLDAEGRPVRHRPDPYQPDDGGTWQVRVLDQQVEVLSTGGQMLQSNTGDTLMLGSTRFAVKIVPKAYQPLQTFKESSK